MSQVTIYAPGATVEIFDRQWIVGYLFPGVTAVQYPIAEIDWSSLTHLAVAFYTINAQAVISEALFQATENAGRTLGHALVDAAHANGCKAVASFGGAGSAAMFRNAAAAANRAALVQAIKAIIVGYGYDGIDIDWEVLTATDRPLLAALLADLRVLLPDKSLSITAGWVNHNVAPNLGYFATIAPIVDQINVLTYQMTGAWQDWKSGHSSPLYWPNVAGCPTGIDITVDAYLAAGVPAAKLGLGCGFYGLGYTAPVNGPQQALNGSVIAAGDQTLNYGHIMAAYHSADAYHWDAGAKVPFLSFPAPHGPQNVTYITYENEESIAEKTAYLKARNLGGMVIWSINESYIAGNPVGQRNPLLSAVRAGMR